MSSHIDCDLVVHQFRDSRRSYKTALVPIRQRLSAGACALMLLLPCFLLPAKVSDRWMRAISAMTMADSP